MSTKEILLRFEDNEFYCAEVKDGIIKGFNVYYWGEFKDGTRFKELHTWCHVDNGIKSGMPESELKILATDEDLEEFDNVFEYNVGYCDSCSDVHNLEDYNPDFIMGDGFLVCKDCAEPEDVLVKVEDVDDIYRSKNIVGMHLEGFEEIETIFHDCGWGGPATNHDGAKSIIDNLLEKHGELYAGLTGVGQFQVYVGLFKRVD